MSSAAARGGDTADHASLGRRALSLCYEVLLLAAVLLVGALPFAMVSGAVDPLAARPLLQIYLLALTAVYFVWQWRRGGQTLAMKTWRIRLVARDGAPLDWAHAARRYLFGLAGTLLAGAGFLWALVDREGQFLHDRLAGTRIVKAEIERRKSEETP
jgi:uncharacterized RDD family membrane protein YckC